MSKAIHPIRKLRLGLERAGAAMPFDPTDVEPVIARHVKPLLDALGETHEAIRESYRHDMLRCDYCRLLAAWRAKC